METTGTYFFGGSLHSLFLVSTRAATANPLDESLSEIIEIDLLETYLPEESLDLLLELNLFSGEANTVNIFGAFFKAFSLQFIDRITEYVPLISVGILLILILKLLSFITSSGDRISDSFGFLAMICSGIYSFSLIETVLDGLSQVVMQISSFLAGALPILCAASAFSGSEDAAMAVSSVLPMVLTAISALISSFYTPMCIFCFAASLSSFSMREIHLRPLVQSIKKICTRGIEIISGLCVGVFCVQRVAVLSSDGMARRSMRFALSQMLPMAGTALASGLESVYACGKSLTGKVGVIAIIVLAVSFSTPCIMGFMLVAIFSFLSSFASTLGVENLSLFYGDVKDTFAMLASFTVCALVVLSSGLLLLSGGWV